MPSFFDPDRNHELIENAYGGSEAIVAAGLEETDDESRTDFHPLNSVHSEAAESAKEPQPAGASSLVIAQAATAVAAKPGQPDADTKLISLWLHGRSQHTQRAYAADARRFLFFAGKPARPGNPRRRAGLR